MPGETPPDEDKLTALLAHVGRAGDIWMREKLLMREVLRLFANRLEEGALSEEHRKLLVSFVRGLNVETDYKTCLAVIGRQDLLRSGAPSKDPQARWWEARDVYEWLIDTGETDEEALRQAWETWVWDPFAPEQLTYEQANSRPAGKGKTQYQQQVNVLKTMLNRAGSRVPAKRGRKPKKE